MTKEEFRKKESEKILRALDAIQRDLLKKAHKKEEEVNDVEKATDRVVGEED